MKTLKIIFACIGGIALLTLATFIVTRLYSNRNKIFVKSNSEISISPIPYIFSQSKLWQLINDYQIKNGWQPYIESSNLCNLADKRLIETSTDWSHNGFYIHAKDFDNLNLGENLAKGYGTERLTLESWINSPTHKKNLTDPYRYSCLRCDKDRCVEIFGNFSEGNVKGVSTQIKEPELIPTEIHSPTPSPYAMYITSTPYPSTTPLKFNPPPVFTPFPTYPPLPTYVITPIGKGQICYWKSHALEAREWICEKL